MAQKLPFIRNKDLTLSSLFGSSQHIFCKGHTYEYATVDEFFDLMRKLLTPNTKELIFYKDDNPTFMWRYNHRREQAEVPDDYVKRRNLLGEDTFFLRRAINDVKKQLFSVVRGKTLLSIGAGRGGDIYKWRDHGFKRVVLVEPDADNRKELEHRLNQNTLPFQWLILPYAAQDADLIMKDTLNFLGKPPSVVSFMLSLTFVNFEDYDHLDAVLKLCRFGRYLIVLGADATLVRQVYNTCSLQNVTLEIKDEEADDPLTPGLRSSKRSASVVINIPNSIVQDQEEYLVDLNMLVSNLTTPFLDLKKAHATMNDPCYQMVEFGEFGKYILPNDDACLFQTYRAFILERLDLDAEDVDESVELEEEAKRPEQQQQKKEKSRPWYKRGKKSHKNEHYHRKQ